MIHHSQHIGRKGGMFFNLLFVSRAVVQVRQLKFWIEINLQNTTKHCKYQ